MNIRTALDLLNDCRNRQRLLSFGCPVLDQQMGPILTQGITEVAGEAGCGKTQLCMVLALQAVMQSNISGSAAIMSCGEGVFPIKRLADLAHEYESLYPSFTAQSLLTRVHIMECRNQEQACETIMKTVPDMCRQNNVRILIIDSLAGLVRFEYDVKQVSQMLERTIYLFNFARQLKWISDIYGIAVLVINQVTAVVNDEDKDTEAIPALGMVWSCCVNTRIILSKSKRARDESLSTFVNEEGPEKQEQESTLISASTNNNISKPTCRNMRIDFSPCYPTASVNFEIRNNGIRGIRL